MLNRIFNAKGNVVVFGISSSFKKECLLHINDENFCFFSYDNFFLNLIENFFIGIEYVDDRILIDYLIEHYEDLGLSIEPKNYKKSIINLFLELRTLQKENIKHEFYDFKNDENLKQDVVNIYEFIEKYKHDNSLKDKIDVYKMFLMNDNSNLFSFLSEKYIFFESVSMLDEIDRIVVLKIYETINCKKYIFFENYSECVKSDDIARVFFSSKIFSEIEILDICNDGDYLKNDNSKPFLVESDNEYSFKYYLLKNILENQDKKILVIVPDIFCSHSVFDFLKSENIKANVFSYNILKNSYVSKIIDYCRLCDSVKNSDIFFFELFKEALISECSIRSIYRIAKAKNKSIWEIITNDSDILSLSLFDCENLSLKNICNKISSIIDKKDNFPVDILIDKIIKTFNLLDNNSVCLDKIDFFSISNFMQNVSICKKRGYDLRKINDFFNNVSDMINAKIDVDDLIDIDIAMPKDFFNIKDYDRVYISYANQSSYSFKEGYCSSQAQFLDLIDDMINLKKLKLEVVYLKKQDSFNKKMMLIFEDLKDNFAFKKDLQNNVFELKLNKKEQVLKEIASDINDAVFKQNSEKFEQAYRVYKSVFLNDNSLLSFDSETIEKIKFYKNKINGSEDLNLKKFKIKPQSMVYSVSQLKTYKSCPKKYMYSYIYKIPSLPKHFFDFGISVHSVLEKIVVDLNEKTYEQVFPVAIKLFKSGWVSKGYESVLQEKEYFEKGIDLISKFIKKEHAINMKNKKVIVGLEKTFNINFMGKKIYGIIDRIEKEDNSYVIVDYKTSGTMMSNVDIKQDIQLFVYANAVKELFGVYPKKLILWYVLFDVMIEVEWKDIDHEKIGIQISEIINDIEQERFSAKPSKFNCDFCDYKSICKERYD